MCMVRPRSSMNWRNGWSTTPSIIAGVDPGLVVFLDLRVGQCRDFCPLLIRAIPMDGLADRLRVIPGWLPPQVMVGAIAVELQPVVLMRRIGIALDFYLAAAPEPDHVA